LAGYYGYAPSKGFAIFAVIAFLLSTLLHLYQTGLDYRRYKR
jgi:hypothetical protein